MCCATNPESTWNRFASSVSLGIALLALAVVSMFQHPGGIGAEKLVGPVVGLVGFGFFAGGGACLYVANRLDKLIKSRRPE